MQPKVLIVDDMEDARLSVVKTLKEFEVDIFTAESGKDAVRQAVENEFALITLDVQMPEMDGFKAAELIRYFGKSTNTPIIFISGSALDEQHQFRGYEVGAVDYLTKPFHRSILRSKLRVFLDLYRQKQLIEAQRQQLEHSLAAQKKISRNLEIAQQRAEAANQSKSIYLANMSHEIRTPLNSIIGYAKLMERRLSKPGATEKVRKYLEHIDYASNVLVELISNVLDLSKIEAGKTEAHYETLDLKRLCEGIIYVNKSTADEKNVLLGLDIAPGVPEKILSDRTKLNQILMNLVTNAIKFTPGDKAVRLTVEKTAQSLVFKVVDEGIGIASDRLGSIFNQFEQADQSTMINYGGTGLGLTITQSLARLLGGKISVESEVGVGSTFTVVLPLLEPQRDIADQSMSQLDAVFEQDQTILVAEDNPMNIEMIREIFAELNLEIVVAENGQICVEKAKELRPDLIIVDVHMPAMNGMEAIQAIRENEPLKQTPIILFTADAFLEKQEMLSPLGVVDQLTKPIQLDLLVPVLKKYLRVRQDAI